jgi:hypothetical protein
MTRRDRIIRLAKLRGDKAALAIMEARREEHQCDEVCIARARALSETERRAMWGDR